jgi:hypothetical protein
MMDNEDIHIDDSFNSFDDPLIDYNLKKNRPNTFQIATRNKIFVIEVKNLVDLLSETNLIKFGDLVLFNDKIVKLGKIKKFFTTK